MGNIEKLHDSVKGNEARSLILPHAQIASVSQSLAVRVQRAKRRRSIMTVILMKNDAVEK
jgi:hypothetical protein